MNQGFQTAADFSSELYPQRMQSGQIGQVRVHNQGNSVETFTINLQDRANNLIFYPPQIRLQVWPGQTAAAEFRADPRQKSWVGGTQSHRILATVRSEKGVAQTLGGEVLSRAVIPFWIPAVAAILCLLIGAFGVLAYLGFSTIGNTQHALIAGQTNTAFAAMNLSAQQTLAIQNAGAATATAAAATALAQGDDDGDGLGNATEVSLGTNPSNPDTDGDGLLDGAEVNVHGTDPKNQDSDGDALPDGKEVNEAHTSPKNPDTDADGVNDGSEVSMGTNPLDPDTDHDGLPDGADPAPLFTSTATLNIGATAQAAANQTAAAQTSYAYQTSAAGTAAAQNSANATATAKMAATQTAQAIPRIVYIYNTDLAKANTFKNLLQSNGYTVDVVQQSSVASVDYSKYRCILIGPDTKASGGGSPWGDPAGSEAGYIDSSGRPILGLGEGGAYFFEARNLFIGHPNTWESSGGDMGVFVMNSNHGSWKNPNTISIPGSNIVKLYSSNSPFHAIYLPGSESGVTPIGRQPDDTEHHIIISEDVKYLLWGYEDGPANMTNTGKKVFINAVHSITTPFLLSPGLIITFISPLIITP